MRTDMTPQVDPTLVKIYRGILMDKLQKPEEWKQKEGDSDHFISTYVNPATKTYFETMGLDGSYYKTDYVEIRQINEYSVLYELKLDRKCRRLVKSLHRYMLLKTEWAKFEKINKKLKNALPENIDRFLKITKIKDKL